MRHQARYRGTFKGAILLMIGWACLAKVGPADAQEFESKSLKKGTVDATLRISLDAVIDEEGEKLVAGKNGWICLAFGNVTDQEFTLRTVMTAAKGFPERKPSLSTTSPFYGVGIARLTYEFVPAKPNVAIPTAGQIAPPDDPVVLKANEQRQVWRRVVAPKLAGRYRLKVKFSNGPVVAAARSYNLLGAGADTFVGADFLSEEFEVIDGQSNQ